MGRRAKRRQDALSREMFEASEKQLARYNEEQAIQRELLEEQKDKYRQFEFENPYANMKNQFENMENFYEDMEVDMRAANFQTQQMQQQQANIMQTLSGAAGGSGIAGLAQSLAQQGQIAAQKQSADIGRQEAQNQMAERRMAGDIQAKEREGEMISRRQQTEQTGTLLGMAQERTAAAASQAAAAKEAKWGAISGGIMGAAKMVPGFGEGLQGGGIFGESGAGAGDGTDSGGLFTGYKDGKYYIDGVAQ